MPTDIQSIPQAGMIQALVSEHPQLDDLFPSRPAAREAMSQLDIPTRKWEDWKYINLKSLQKAAFEAASSVELAEVTSMLIPGLDADILVFVNGQFQAGLSDLSRNTGHIHVAPLSGLSETEADIVRTHIGTLAEDDNIFTAANTAYTQEGTLVYVPKGKVAPSPIHILHIAAGDQAAQASQHRTLIVAEERSEVQLVESYHTIGDTSYFHNQVSELFVGANAHVTHVALQQSSLQAAHIGTTLVRQHTQSVCKVFTLTFGGELVRNNLIVKLAGQHTETHLMGTYLLDGQQQVDNFTQVHHMEPNCYSNELYKGIVDGNASAAFTGRINVYEDAQKTNAYQSNRNIILSDTANMYTKPQLEIYADDVKCSHGATTGRIDKEALFYLQARGIPLKEAQKMMIHAFTMEVVDHIPLEPVVSYVESLINQRF